MLGGAVRWAHACCFGIRAGQYSCSGVSLVLSELEGPNCGKDKLSVLKPGFLIEMAK
jgi:hypothetical protein